MGALQDYLKEVRRLTPEDAQPEVLTFVSTIDQNGLINFQSPSVRVASGFMFACNQIRGGCPMPPAPYPDDSGSIGNRLWTMPEFLPYIGFNVINEGRNKPMFKLPLAMTMFVDSGGTTQGLKFEVPMTFFEGADISVEWFVDINSVRQTYPGGPGNIAPRVFNPAFNDNTVAPNNVIRVEFYAYLIGTLIRAETVV